MIRDFVTPFPHIFFMLNPNHMTFIQKLQSYGLASLLLVSVFGHMGIG